jgi:glycosyltransferase involved in cell wall biosynthesis
MIYVLALYSDMSGCGDYRVRFPAEAVTAREHEFGVHVEVSDHLDADATKTPDKTHIRRVDVPGGIDVVSFQRPLGADMVGAIAWLRYHRPDLGIVVELDDDLANVPTSNTAYAALHPATSPAENYTWLRRAIALSDVLTVSTPSLAETYGQGSTRTFVIRNGVPTSMLYQPARALSLRRHKSDGFDRVVGWAGYAGTHGGDLEMTSGALQDVIGAAHWHGGNVTFRQVGPREGVAKALGLEEGDVEATGWMNPTSMYRVALGEMDVGIVPLADTRFNRGKSALKMLEMAAAGVPVVASHTAEHDLLQQQGMPVWLVKDRRRQWASALNRVLGFGNEELHDVASAHREFVRRFHTIDSRVEEWATAWRTAVKLARKG